MPDALERLTIALADRYRIEVGADGRPPLLGQGGMATVYLAQDLRHNRRVAVKVLRPELAAVLGADRFLSEITTTANLQHPHILPLFDSGEADGFLYYVMPYVEGETVRDRLTREKQLPVEDAVRIATEVAAALDYAHRQGVVHRDIKPENILLHDGSALVADFGIALAASRADARLTATGISLGTPCYMSPEQAMGEREITARSDVYALGSVLYEMLSGDPPFTGNSPQAIVARVLAEQPRPLAAHRHTIPPQVEAAVFRSLEKLPADRFATAADFAAALRTAPPAVRSPGQQAAHARPSAAARYPFLLPGAVAMAGALLATWGWFQGRAPKDAPTSWQFITFGDSVTPPVSRSALAISPDGEAMVVKDDAPGGNLWIKRQTALQPVRIAGTEGAASPSFSPDGEWLAFVQGQHLKKVRLSSGAIVPLADSALGFGGTAWLDDGTIVFVSQNFSQILRTASDSGNTVVVVDNAALPGIGLVYPHALPRARGVLFQGCTSGCTTMSLRVVDFETGAQRVLVDEASDGWYLPGGYLLYARRDGTALVAPFDLDRLEVTGSATPALEQVVVYLGLAQMAVSPSGSAFYAAGPSASGNTTIVRKGLDGTSASVDSGWVGRITSLALSPDGRRLALGQGSGVGEFNIWIKQLDRGPVTRLSFGGNDRRPAWSPDGRMVAFLRDTNGTSVVMGSLADGSRPATLLARLDRQVQEVEWSPDGAWLVLRTDNSRAGAGDLVGIRTRGDTTPVPLVATPFTERTPAVSPDSRWLAYTSNESGRNEVYVAPFPNAGEIRWQVSTGGGDSPVWAPDGRKLYFLSADQMLMTSNVAGSPSFTAGEPMPQLRIEGTVRDEFHTAYSIAPDGRSFLFIAPEQYSAAARPPQFVRVDHWFRDLKERLAK